MTTARAPSATIRRAASRRSSSVRIAMPGQHLRLGNVRRHDEGLRAAAPSSSRRALRRRAGGRRSWRPSPDRRRERDRRGPRPPRRRLRRSRRWPACRSSRRARRCRTTTASICAVTRSADSASNVVTPRVFCAVTAVMALSAVHAVRGEGLEVGLDARAARRNRCRRWSAPCAWRVASAMRRYVRRRRHSAGNDAGGDGELDQIRQRRTGTTPVDERGAAGRSARCRSAVRAKRPSHVHAARVDDDAGRRASRART